MQVKQFFTVDDLVLRWGVNRKVIRAWAHNGTIPLPVRINVRCWLWPVALIEKFEQFAMEPEPQEASNEQAQNA